jgi:signal peptidase II
MSDPLMSGPLLPASGAERPPVDPSRSPPPDPAGSAGASRSESGRRFARPFELGAIAVVIVLDQVTKALVRASLPLGDSRPLIPGFVDLAHVQNTGAAFGMLNDIDFAYKPVIMVIVAALALVAIAAYGTQLGFNDRVARLGLALILGGAFGNLADRAMRGHVVDFVDVYWGSIHFWAFNVADAAISIGAVLVILDTLGLGRRHVSHPV